MTGDSQPLTVIEPRRGFRLRELRELWRYRELLGILAWRDIQVRYRQTVLGIAWAIIQPLLRVFVFTLVFVGIMKLDTEGVPGPVFMHTGQVPWLLFATAISQMGMSLVASASLVTKVYFPRLLLPLAAMGAPLIDALISSGVLVLLMYALGYPPSWITLPWILPALVALLLLATGIGVLLAAFTVTYHDFRHVTPFLVTLWMFLTPVVWPMGQVAEAHQIWYRLNPMNGVVTTFRAAFLGTHVDYFALGVSLGVGLVLALVAGFVFTRFERRFADVI